MVHTTRVVHEVFLEYLVCRENPFQSCVCTESNTGRSCGRRTFEHSAAHPQSVIIHNTGPTEHHLVSNSVKACDRWQLVSHGQTCLLDATSFNQLLGTMHPGAPHWTSNTYAIVIAFEPWPNNFPNKYFGSLRHHGQMKDGAVLLLRCPKDQTVQRYRIHLKATFQCGSPHSERLRFPAGIDCAPPPTPPAWPPIPLIDGFRRRATLSQASSTVHTRLRYLF